VDFGCLWARDVGVAWVTDLPAASLPRQHNLRLELIFQPDIRPAAQPSTRNLTGVYLHAARYSNLQIAAWLL
jgi:hypothetical protein